MTGTFEILILAALQRPPEQCGDDENQHQGKRNQEIQNIHEVIQLRCSRSALRTTSSELADMPMPAIQGVTQPAMASGIARKL